MKSEYRNRCATESVAAHAIAAYATQHVMTFLNKFMAILFLWRNSIAKIALPGKTSLTFLSLSLFGSLSVGHLEIYRSVT